MPIYEYLCRKCGQFETTQRITEAPLEKCPTCRGKVTRLISQTSFQLKGSGWYATDYARGSNGQKKKDGGEAAASAESKGEAKSDSTSKAESKAEGKPASSSTTTSTS
jgi:putative FmdB family regulatory protein